MDETARQRITRWLDAAKITQAEFAEKIGRNQAWMSRYLDGEYDADLETLQKMAEVSEHRTIATLIGSAPDPALIEAWELFLAMGDEARAAAIPWFRLMTRPATGRKRSVKRGAAELPERKPEDVDKPGRRGSPKR